VLKPRKEHRNKGKAEYTNKRDSVLKRHIPEVLKKYRGKKGLKSVRKSSQTGGCLQNIAQRAERISLGAINSISRKGGREANISPLAESYLGSQKV